MPNCTLTLQNFTYFHGKILVFEVAKLYMLPGQILQLFYSEYLHFQWENFVLFQVWNVCTIWSTTFWTFQVLYFAPELCYFILMVRYFVPKSIKCGQTKCNILLCFWGSIARFGGKICKSLQHQLLNFAYSELKILVFSVEILEHKVLKILKSAHWKKF